MKSRSFFASLELLLVRIVLAAVFVPTGWGKLHDLDKVTGFFEKLGIPWPHFNATLVGTCELVGGLLILFGLLTRFAIIPLMITMAVAIATAKMGDVKTVFDFLTLEEVTYFVMLAALGVFGAGLFSLDHLMPAWWPSTSGGPESPSRGFSAKKSLRSASTS